MKKKSKMALLGGIILFIGLSLFFVYFNQNKTRNLSQKENNTSVSKTEKKKKETVINIESSVNKKKSTVEEATSAEEKKHISEFKQDIISNGLYVNLGGTLEPANEKNLKDIEKKIKNPVIQDVEKDGKIIKVLSDSIEQTEGDK
ncbi:hypothetical protein GYN67_05270 [Lactococcus piscium]|uniref:hypothetical protein n=1 Tax=Pseudolactococcus carnosus TaxID=2749961 RepID=UPI001FBBA920|nr:hypothetical protein [Lactococcus carnosus]MCJ1996091.1 hypothetical protein [Lactococcus carnosus]